MTVLRAARVVTGDGGMSASPAWVVLEAGRIVATGTGDAPSGADDLGDALLAPGFVDLQVNGFGAVDFAVADVADVVDALDGLARDGMTGCLLTLVTAELDAYGPALARLGEVCARTELAAGVHLEGPFLGGAPGAHPVGLVRPVDLAWLAALLDDHGDLVRLVTLAPEADPDLAGVRLLAGRGVTVALGHTRASYDDARRAADAGASMVTHLFNGMGPLHHREPGVAGAALDDRRLVPSLIADGVHVHPAALRFATTVRPDAVLVTDAVADAVGGPPAAPDDAVRLADGTLAGSVLTAGAAVRNLRSFGVGTGQAVRMMTGNPARAIGLDDRGRIAPGCRADLVALDPETLEVRAVWVSGVRRHS